jgi:hypothetical protein
MLANGRPEMARRAAQSFLAQTYEGHKDLLVWNNPGNRSIGWFRNEANATVKADIILHWDSDDWSHPNRIAEQVALLQSSGAECVGYDEMLFFTESDTARMAKGFYGVSKRPSELGLEESTAPKGEAWLYRAAVPNYAVGTSMCYWRETWQRNPFPDRSEGCDDLDWFNRGVKIESVSSVQIQPDTILEPSARMIASIHGGNTCAKIDAGMREWRRVPQWDAYCREAMKLRNTSILRGHGTFERIDY